MQRPRRRCPGRVIEGQSNVSKNVMRISTAIALAVFLVGCQGADPAKVLNPNPQPAIDQQTQSEVVQGTCPQVNLREGTAYFRTYAKGGDNNPDKVVHQGNISTTTRQCRISGGDMIMTVQAAGRVVAGPEGGAGTVSLPIRIVVLQGSDVLYSELQKQSVELPAGEPTAQFLFTNASVTFPAASAAGVRVYAGFDPGPYNTP